MSLLQHLWMQLPPWWRCVPSTFEIRSTLVFLSHCSAVESVTARTSTVSLNVAVLVWGGGDEEVLLQIPRRIARTTILTMVNGVCRTCMPTIVVVASTSTSSCEGGIAARDDIGACPAVLGWLFLPAGPVVLACELFSRCGAKPGWSLW